MCQVLSATYRAVGSEGYLPLCSFCAFYKFCCILYIWAWGGVSSFFGTFDSPVVSSEVKC